MPRGRPKRARTRRNSSPARSMRGVYFSLTGYRNRLLGQRAELENKISAIEGAMQAMGVAIGARPAAAARAVGARRVGRAPRSGSLKEYVEKVLSASRTVMAVKDITAAVRKAGYSTRNKTLAKSVGAALKGMRSVAKVGRGRFRLK